MNRKNRAGRVVCPVCGIERAAGEVVSGEMVRESVAAEIRRDHTGWTPADVICLPDLVRYRGRHVKALLEAEKGELTVIEREVIDSLAKSETLAHDVDARFDEKLTLGERAADRIATFGGSWGFIGLFGAILAGWIGLNVFILVARPFDPYPFILLNLVLSCLAALQAPVIMMSQNRQEAKDRARSQQDYRVNLKAELEIRHLHEKLDHLLSRQWERLVEIQEIQMDLMEEILRQGGKR